MPGTRALAPTHFRFSVPQKGPHRPLVADEADVGDAEAPREGRRRGDVLVSDRTLPPDVERRSGSLILRAAAR